MRARLEAAAIPSTTREMVPKIIQTCRECRAWATPGPDTQYTNAAEESFNETVEFDIMFYKDHKIFHGIDRASRWHETQEIMDKEEQTLTDAFYDWVGRHVAMKKAVYYGEGGLNTTDFEARVKRY